MHAPSSCLRPFGACKIGSNWGGVFLRAFPAGLRGAIPPGHPWVRDRQIAPPSLESAIHLHLHWLHLRVHLKRSYFRFFCSLPRRERFIKSDAATSALFLFCIGFACSVAAFALTLANSSMARKSSTSSKGFTPLAPKKNVSFSQLVIGSPTFKTRVSWARCELNTRNDGRKG